MVRSGNSSCGRAPILRSCARMRAKSSGVENGFTTKSSGPARRDDIASAGGGESPGELQSESAPRGVALRFNDSRPAIEDLEAHARARRMREQLDRRSARRGAMGILLQVDDHLER